MNIQITAKKIEIPQEIREYATEKFEKLEKFNHHIQAIEAVIKAEDRVVICEMIVRIDNQEAIVIEVQGDTIQAAVDLAESKAERQIRKSKERASVRRRAARAEEREMP